MKSMKLLLVEDERVLAPPIKEALEGEGHTVDWVEDGQLGWEYAQTFPYDLLILDWMVPGLSGVELTGRLRARGNHVPVLMLTARDAPQDRVAGLDSGADDYLVKPFHLDELLARVRALGRRALPFTPERLCFADLELDTRTMVAHRAGRSVQLNRKEFQLLELLMRHPGQVFTREQILVRLWEAGGEPESNVVAAHVRLLRRKIDEGFSISLIQTVYGIGYRLADQ